MEAGSSGTNSITSVISQFSVSQIRANVSLSLIHISIDNTKKMVLEGLSEALHVSIEWLKGETDEYETDITDKKELQIRDAMGDILKQLSLIHI